MIQRIVKFFSSLRTTIYLIVLLGIVFLLGLWIPQKGVLQQELYLLWQAKAPGLVSLFDTLGFTEIYASPLTLSLWVLFFLNLSLVSWRRIPAIKNKIALSDVKLEDPESALGYTYKTTLELPASIDPAGIPQLLAHGGYVFYGLPERFYAVKNRFSPVASILFHLSFFLILLGGVVSIYSKFSGVLDLAEGEEFHGELTHYEASPRLPKLGNPPNDSFLITGITPTMEKDTATGLQVKIRDASGTVHVADINRPYKSGNTSYVIKNLGVAPLVVVKDQSGRELDGAFVKLDVLKGKRDSFELAGYRFSVLFYPDYYVAGGMEGSRSEQFRNPAFNLTVAKNGRTVARKTVRPHESITFDQFSLEIEESVLWVKLYVVKEYGLEIIYAGFFLATIGLIWRLVYYRRELVGSVKVVDGKNLLSLAGRAELYRVLAEDEFSRLVDRLFRQGRRGQAGRRIA